MIKLLKKDIALLRRILAAERRQKERALASCRETEERVTASGSKDTMRQHIAKLERDLAAVAVLDRKLSEGQ